MFFIHIESLKTKILQEVDHTKILCMIQLPPEQQVAVLELELCRPRNLHHPQLLEG